MPILKGRVTWFWTWGRNETQDCPGPSSLLIQAPGPAKPPHSPDGSHLRWVEIDILGTAVLVPRDCRLVIEALLDVQSSQLILGGGRTISRAQQGPSMPNARGFCPRHGGSASVETGQGNGPRSQPASPRPSLPGHGKRESLGQARPPPSRGSGGTGPSRPATTGTQGSLPPPQPPRAAPGPPHSQPRHGNPAPRLPPHARPPHLLLLGVLRVDVRRAEARALERAVLVAEDAEGRHPRPAGG